MISRNDSCFVPLKFEETAEKPRVDSREKLEARQERLKGCAPVCDRQLSGDSSVAGAPGSEGGPFPAAVTFAELQGSGPAEPKWLWHGYLAAGSMTLVTGLWRSGKTTLLSVLLSRLGAGGMLGGRALAEGRAVVISEEDKSLWRMRGQTLAFGPDVSWYCRPFVIKPSLKDWEAFLDQIQQDHDERERIDLLVVDGLANLSPLRSENEAGEMLKTLRPLQTLASRGMSVWISHHPSKKRTRAGLAARGSGALPGFVDIIVEMGRVSQRGNDRRRRLRAYSRYPETPAQWVIERTPDGRDYVSLGESTQLSFERGWPIMKRILERAEGRLTWRQIVQRWPENETAPAKTTISRWLDRLLQDREVSREGRGTSSDPFVYLLPGMEIKWQDDMLNAALVRAFEAEPAPKRRRR